MNAWLQIPIPWGPPKPPGSPPNKALTGALSNILDRDISRLEAELKEARTELENLKAKDFLSGIRRESESPLPERLSRGLRKLLKKGFSEGWPLDKLERLVNLEFTLYEKQSGEKNRWTNWLSGRGQLGIRK